MLVQLLKESVANSKHVTLRPPSVQIRVSNPLLNIAKSLRLEVLLMQTRKVKGSQKRRNLVFCETVHSYSPRRKMESGSELVSSLPPAHLWLTHAAL